MISPTSLVWEQKFFWIMNSKTRLVELILLNTYDRIFNWQPFIHRVCCVCTESDIFEKKIKKYVVIVKKAALGENKFSKNKFADTLCCLFVKNATVQIWGQSNESSSTCIFQKGDSDVHI